MQDCYFILQDSPSSTLRYTLDTTESLQGKAFSGDTQGSALATQLGILKDRMDDIEVRQKRSMNSNTRKVSDYKLLIVSYSPLFRGTLRTTVTFSVKCLFKEASIVYCRILLKLRTA